MTTRYLELFDWLLGGFGFGLLLAGFVCDGRPEWMPWTAGVVFSVALLLDASVRRRRRAGL